jgi:hypothetical protein
MRLLQSAAVALVIAGLLYLRLDSGAVEPGPAPRLMSVPLAALGLIFGVGAWATAASGSPRRPWLAGLAAGVGGYALVRLVAF